MAERPAPQEFRSVEPIPVPGITPNQLGDGRPSFEWVDPRELFVEQAYQRGLSERSVSLIRRIVQDWAWDSLKPPVCARTADGRLVVIDGQHTAIAAATHPGVASIPVMIVGAEGISDRARAFIRHNSDRIAMTVMQIHHAALAAGDEVAMAMEQAAAKAHVRILRVPPGNGDYKVGDTVAVRTLQGITERKGVNFTARVLSILVDAQRAPLAAQEISAVAALLSEPEWKDSLDRDDLVATIRSKTVRQWTAHAESNVRKGMKMPMHRALALDWFKSTPKRRGRANG